MKHNTYFQQVEQLQAAPPPVHSERQYLHTQQAGFIVPLLQSVVTAVIVGLVTLVLAWKFYWMDPLGSAAITMVIALAMWWGVSLWRWTKLTNREPMIVEARNVDHDDDPSTPEIVRIQLEDVKENGHYHVQNFDLPISEQQLAALAAGLIGGLPFSERQWTGAGKLLTTNEFRTLRSEMIKRGLIAPASGKDSRQGYVLTRPGRAVMKHYSPTPPEED